MKCERDAFDALFDHAPDKLQVVKKVTMFLFIKLAIHNKIKKKCILPEFGDYKIVCSNCMTKQITNFYIFFLVTHYVCEQASHQGKPGSHRPGHAVS